MLGVPMEEMIVIVGTSLDTLADYLEMKFGLSAQQVAEVVDHTDGIRREIKGKMEDLLRRPAAVVPLHGRQVELDV